MAGLMATRRGAGRDGGRPSEPGRRLAGRYRVGRVGPRVLCVDPEGGRGALLRGDQHPCPPVYRLPGRLRLPAPALRVRRLPPPEVAQVGPHGTGGRVAGRAAQIPRRTGALCLEGPVGCDVRPAPAQAGGPNSRLPRWDHLCRAGRRTTDSRTRAAPRSASARRAGSPSAAPSGRARSDSTLAPSRGRSRLRRAIAARRRSWARGSRSAAASHRIWRCRAAPAARRRLG